MPLRNNKKAKIIINFLVCGVFFIPVLIDRIFKKKHNFVCKSILVLEPWGVGDLVLMSFILKSLREHFPGAKITLFSKTFGCDLFNYSAFIDEYVSFDLPWTRFKGKYLLWRWDWVGLFKIISKLRNKRFDLTLDARGDIRSNLFSFLISAKKSIGYNWSGGSYFLTDILPTEERSQHRVDAWIKLLVPFGITVKTKEPAISVSNKEITWAETFLSNYDIKPQDLLVGLHPGAGVKTRCWPIDRFAKVAEHARDKYGAKIVIFVEPDGYGQDIPIKGQVLKIRASLREMMSVIKRLNFLICNDAGPMHIAAAFKIPLLAIMGPGDLKVIGPYDVIGKIIIKDNVKCRPCFDYCIYKESFCINNITLADALVEFDKCLALATTLSN